MELGAWGDGSAKGVEMKGEWDLGFDTEDTLCVIFGGRM